ncbi:myo-inositol-1(or 4)-monophosphatase [Marivita hallyeonensis]|uniref:Inositol-1-monophosphatase n=2 Tax=Marivita hallyeonensis TaxID=996342 RepID=A0A1M5S6K1_9RHOB|nr:myo-inositol-1(or 4)-monophosphatase [Marivita hallyeonensis]
MLAGEGLIRAARDRSRLSITEKTVGDFVSEADHEAEETIATYLNQSFPGYGWLGEESGERLSQADGLRWIVDPLDGTTNFLKGLPHWAVSIALYRGDDPLCAVIHDPIKAETFSAERGCGAYLNGQPIHVAPSAPLPTMLLATGVPSGGRITYLPHCLSDLDALMPQTAGIRRWGAAALDLAYVAAGRLDAYWERNLGPWDIAAGALIVEEAGGQMLPLWPDRTLLQSGSFLAGHPDTVAGILLSLDRGMR